MKEASQDVLDGTLAKMAALVRDQPTITVRELASSLGFAEERSVYYWLKKAGYEGIRDFREEILRQATESEGTDRRTLPLQDRIGRLDGLPVKALSRAREQRRSAAVEEAAEPFRTGRPSGAPGRPRFNPTKNAPSPLSWLPALGEGAYALTVESPGYAPVLLQGDILIVDPDGTWDDGDIVVVERAGGKVVIGRSYGADPILLVHLVHPQESLEIQAAGRNTRYRVAPVVQLIRSFR